MPAPQSNGADVSEIFIQHDRDHAQDVGQATRYDFEFEIKADDLTETLSDPHRLADWQPHSAKTEERRIIGRANDAAFESNQDKLVDGLSEPDRLINEILME